MIDFSNPKTGTLLEESGDLLHDSLTGEVVARRRAGLYRFVDNQDDYAQNFGFQWNTWHDVQSESRGSNLKHKEDLQYRSGLWDGACEVKGARVLECGMGGGDDTEVLLSLPVAEVNAFDISSSVDRAARYLSDDRLRIFQASIYEIPFAAESFDIVWCHRVLQHTPDPEKAMRCVCRMVKPGGFLFVHCYKRSRRYMQEFKYKYRWLTKRLPRALVYWYVQYCGGALHRLNKLLYQTRWSREFAYRFVPLYTAPIAGVFRDMSDSEKLEWEKLATFDALTPAFDAPMTTAKFREILQEEGFTIDWLFDPETSPLLARATKTSQL